MEGSAHDEAGAGALVISCKSFFLPTPPNSMTPVVPTHKSTLSTSTTLRSTHNIAHEKLSERPQG